MNQGRSVEDSELLEGRLERLERRVTHGTRRVGKIDSDSPLLPSMDDFNFSEDEFAAAEASGALEWTAPYLFPNGNSRGLTWDSGPGGSLYLNCSAGFIDTTGELLSFIDAAEVNSTGVDTAYRFAKTHYRFYYRHPERDGELTITATFHVRNARIHDTICSQGGEVGAGRTIDLLEFQNLRIAAYRQRDDAWERFGKVIDEYHELSLEIPAKAGQSNSQTYDINRSNPRHKVVMTSRGEVLPGQLIKFYVGIWAGLTLRTDGYGYATFNRFDVRLEKVRAELLQADSR